MKSTYHLEYNEEKNKWIWTITSADEVISTEYDTMNHAIESLTLSYTLNLVREMLDKHINMEIILESMAKYFLSVTKSAIKEAKKGILNDEINKNNGKKDQ